MEKIIYRCGIITVVTALCSLVSSLAFAIFKISEISAYTISPLLWNVLSVSLLCAVIGTLTLEVLRFNTPSNHLAARNAARRHSLLAIVALFLSFGIAMTVVSFPGPLSAANVCINNLRIIDSAKWQWAADRSAKETAVPTRDELLPYLRSPITGANIPKFPNCPVGGDYSINALSNPPTCSIETHRLP